MRLAAGKILAMSVLLAMAMAVNAQASQEELKFLNSFFTSKFSKHSTIYYTSNLFMGEKSSMKNDLKSYASGSRTREDTLNALNKNEISYAISAIDSLQKISWSDSIVKNARLVPDDTLNVLYKKIEQEWDCLNKYGGEIWSFSHPIFLRGGTLCIFYCGSYSNPLCAFGRLSIYRKVGDAWVELERISEWIS